MNSKAPTDHLIDEAIGRLTEPGIVILPRADGQYLASATDVAGLLRSLDLPVGYATDPIEAGVYALKSADQFLPPLLLVFNDAATLAQLVQGVIWVVQWIEGRLPKSKIWLEVITQRGSDGSSRREARMSGVTADEAVRILKAAGKVDPPE